jgi:hypothetical protein
LPLQRDRQANASSGYHPKLSVANAECGSGQVKTAIQAMVATPCWLSG